MIHIYAYFGSDPVIFGGLYLCVTAPLRDWDAIPLYGVDCGLLRFSPLFTEMRRKGRALILWGCVFRRKCRSGCLEGENVEAYVWRSPDTRQKTGYLSVKRTNPNFPRGSPTVDPCLFTHSVHSNTHLAKTLQVLPNPLHNIPLVHVPLSLPGFPP